MRYAMIIDLTKCVGCNACTIACKTNNGIQAGIFWSRVITEENGTYPNARMEFTPILCMHCKKAPCVRTCPTGASQKLENGIVWIDEDRCIGCRSCIVACPYEAPRFEDAAKMSQAAGRLVVKDIIELLADAMGEN